MITVTALPTLQTIRKRQNGTFLLFTEIILDGRGRRCCAVNAMPLPATQPQIPFGVTPIMDKRWEMDIFSMSTDERTWFFQMILILELPMMRRCIPAAIYTATALRKLSPGTQPPRKVVRPATVSMPTVMILMSSVLPDLFTCLPSGDLIYNATTVIQVRIT